MKRVQRRYRRSQCLGGCLLLLGVTLAEAAPVQASETHVIAEVGKTWMEPRVSGYDATFSIALEGDLMVTGSDGADGAAASSGSAWVFERLEGGGWKGVAELVAPDGEAFDGFGGAVSACGERIAVGAVDRDGPDGQSRAGAVYLFERAPAGGWSFAARLAPTDPMDNARFGEWVDLDGDRLAVGSPGDAEMGVYAGAAFIFERGEEGLWTQKAKLLAVDGAALDNLGTRGALEGDRLAVSAPGYKNPQAPNGAVYLFELQHDGRWLPVKKFISAVGSKRSGFSSDVSLSGDRLAIGASEDDNRAESAGAVYIFERGPDAVWRERAQLTAADAAVEDSLGVSVSLQGDYLLAGSRPGDEYLNLTESGPAYLFERRSDGSWRQASRLEPLNMAPGDEHGWPVAYTDGVAVVVSAQEGEVGAVATYESVAVSPQLEVSGSCPGAVEITLSMVTPRARVGLYGATLPGETELSNGPCGGTRIDLEAARGLLLVASDFDASGTLVRSVDEAQCGSLLQVLDETTCLTSPVVELPSSEPIRLPTLHHPR